MSNDVNEIKERLKIEEEDLPADPVKAERGSVADELQSLGKQVAETLKTAWESEERHKIEAEVKEGVRSFANEIDKVIREARESQAAQRVREEASDVKVKVKSGEVSDKARGGLVQGLRWLSEELGKLADQFTVKEKEVDEETTVADEE
jgi:phenylalanyl-tRNA synthetase alpha subunit